MKRKEEPAPVKMLSEDEMNSLGARILRAELMGEEVSGKLVLITDLAKFCTVKCNTTQYNYITKCQYSCTAFFLSLIHI